MVLHCFHNHLRFSLMIIFFKTLQIKFLLRVKSTKKKTKQKEILCHQGQNHCIKGLESRISLVVAERCQISELGAFHSINIWVFSEPGFRWAVTPCWVIRLTLTVLDHFTRAVKEGKLGQHRKYCHLYLTLFAALNPFVSVRGGVGGQHRNEVQLSFWGCVPKSATVTFLFKGV